MFELIIIIVGIIAFLNLSGRISNLELKARKESSVGKKTQESEVRLEHQSRAETSATSHVSVLSDRIMDGGASSVNASSTQDSNKSQDFSATRAISSEEEGGRWLGKIGIVLLLLGVSFFLKYAFDNNIIGVVGRVILGLISGVALLALGQFLRAKYLRYSDILMGGGIGVLYMTIYASFAFYNLISQPVAFVFLFLVTALSVTISIVDNAFTLAAVGIFGGFITPYLVSAGMNSEVALFTYILILDVGVLVISFREKWQKLNYMAFAGTALLFLSWGAQYYSDEHLFITFFFLTAFFLIFLVATVMHHLLRGEVTRGPDLALVTINAFSYFGMSYGMLEVRFHAFMGFFAVAMALLYFLLAFLSVKSSDNDKHLNLYLSGIAILFLTLAIPIQLSGTWITLAWLIEAVIIAGFSTAVPKAKFHAYGPIVYVVGMLRLFSTEIFSGYDYSRLPFFNQTFFLFVVAILAAYVLGFFYDQAEEKEIIIFKPKILATVFLVFANLITVFSLTTEVSRIYERKIQDVYAIQATENVQQINYGSENLAQSFNPYSANSKIVSLQNQKNTAISILWTLYAVILTVAGFALRSKAFRSFGLTFFFVTAFKIFVDVWNLGELYRIISSITFGIVALVGSFVYAKYKDRIKQIITE
ncbi:MAG: DUF2339 domain-containing protein [Candidatus Taylorbacteria bacterium]|nr:DUF2339 domain-containing protein [Candidatus Taylorbacteria bacterium]